MPNFWLKNKYNTMHTLSKARKKSRLIFSCNINLVSFNFCNGLGGPDGPSGPSGADDLSISSGPFDPGGLGDLDSLGGPNRPLWACRSFFYLGY